MRLKGITQPDLASLMKCSQSRISKILTADATLDVDTLAALCFHVGLPVTEVLRDRGMEFFAEMTPSEMRVLEAFRAATPTMRSGVMQVLGITIVEPARAHEPKRKKA